MGFFSNDPAPPPESSTAPAAAEVAEAAPARHDRGVGVQLQVEEPGLVDPPVREHRAARRRVAVDPDLAADAEQSRGREEHCFRLASRRRGASQKGNSTADLNASKKCVTPV